MVCCGRGDECLWKKYRRMGRGEKSKSGRRSLAAAPQPLRDEIIMVGYLLRLPLIKAKHGEHFPALP
jgi:hypothetical protein